MHALAGGEDRRYALKRGKRGSMLPSPQVEGGSYEESAFDGRRVAHGGRCCGRTLHLSADKCLQAADCEWVNPLEEARSGEWRVCKVVPRKEGSFGQEPVLGLFWGRLLSYSNRFRGVSISLLFSLPSSWDESLPFFVVETLKHSCSLFCWTAFFLSSVLLFSGSKGSPPTFLAAVLFAFYFIFLFHCLQEDWQCLPPFSVIYLTSLAYLVLRFLTAA
jgi:hypothetical protein